MVALGAYYELMGTIELETVLRKTLPSLLTGKKAAYLTLNEKAIEAGRGYVRQNVKPKT